jgi:leucyl aminopeptidase
VIEVRTGGPVGSGDEAALLVGAGSDATFDEGAAWVIERMPWITDRLEADEFTGKPGQVAVFPGGEAVDYSQVVFVGLGADPDADAVRRAAGAGARAVKRSASLATTLHGACAGAAGATAAGIALGVYSFGKHKSDPKPALLEVVTFIEGSDDDISTASDALIVADAVALGRDLVNEPAMFKSPETLAEVARGIGDETGVTVRVFDENEIEAERLGGLRGVSLGATNPPRLVEFRYEPEGASATLAMVGKGIVFDSGGLSLKPASAMEEMKTDMSGAAAVFGAVKAIARLGLPVRVIGITPLTENMPGGAAVRPGDVLHTRNGKTIEVLNTDAEGRLVLADGLALAVEAEPDLIVDLATLTGACMVALGKKIAGLFGTDEAVGQVQAAADAAGERMWPMPMPDDYRKQIDSDVADMKNVGERWGGAITAALLLKEFAGEGPWAHIDIAGPARAGEDEGHIVKGGTGFGVATLVELARAMAS